MKKNNIEILLYSIDKTILHIELERLKLSYIPKNSITDSLRAIQSVLTEDSDEQQTKKEVLRYLLQVIEISPDIFDLFVTNLSQLSGIPISDKSPKSVTNVICRLSGDSSTDAPGPQDKPKGNK